MNMPEFTMSKYSKREDLLSDKCAWLEQENKKLKVDVARLTLFVHDIAKELYPYPEQAVRKATEVLDAIRANTHETDIDQAQRFR